MSNDSSDNNEEGSDELSNNDEYSSEEEEIEEWKSLSDAQFTLFEAVTRNDAAALRQALRNGADVNCSSNAYYDRFTPLSSACYHGRDNIVYILLDAGADPWQKTASGGSVISYAVSSNLCGLCLLNSVVIPRCAKLNSSVYP